MKIGQLSPAAYDSLQQILASHGKGPFRDTLLIRYDFNGESCWSTMDGESKSYIMGFVQRHQAYMNAMAASRPKLRIVEYKEEGKNLARMKQWDSTLLTDTGHRIYTLLFNERSACGTSLLLMPDRQFILLRSDAHMELLRMEEKEVRRLLSLP